MGIGPFGCFFVYKSCVVSLSFCDMSNYPRLQLEFNEPNLFCTWRPFIERQSLSLYRYCILLQIIQQQRKSSSSRNVSMIHPFYWPHLDLAYSELRLPLHFYAEWTVGCWLFQVQQDQLQGLLFMQRNYSVGNRHRRQDSSSNYKCRLKAYWTNTMCLRTHFCTLKFITCWNGMLWMIKYHCHWSLPLVLRFCDFFPPITTPVTSTYCRFMYTKGCVPRVSQWTIQWSLLIWLTMIVHNITNFCC